MALNLNTILGDSYWGTEANHLNQNFLLIKAAVEELDSAIISGGGRIRTVYKNSDFGGTFTDSSESDTFNAYAINQLNIRIGTLETKTYQYALSALTDVNITSAIGGQILSFNGSKWINSNISNLLSGYVQESLIGAANGIASLDAGGKVPASQLPSYVDDVLEFSGIVNFPAVGDSGKIYIDTLTNIQYRWSGTQYVEISSSLALGETASSAYPGNKGKANADAIKALQGTVSTLSASLSNYLPLSSGTLTGNLLIQQKNIAWKTELFNSGTADSGGITIYGTDGNASSLRLNHKGVMTWRDYEVYHKGNLPSSFPASDVYAWAKAPTKPAYTASEVGAIAKGGLKTINGNQLEGSGNIVIPVDTELSATSNNAIANKVVKAALDSKANASSLANYLPLSGGTLTGDVVISNPKSSILFGNVNFSEDAKQIFFSASDNSERGYIKYRGNVSTDINDTALEIKSFKGINLKTGETGGLACINSNVIWHKGNDGSGSGLDADLLDGKHNGEINAITLNSRGNHPDGVPISGLNMYQYYGGQTVAQVTPSSYGNILSLNGTSGAVSELAMEWHGSRLFYRSKPDTSTTFTSWRELAGLDSNVASATKLQNARTIWGQSFNGTGNVSGAMSGVKTINFHNGHKIDVETGTGLDLKAASGQGVFFYTNGSTKFSGFDSTGLFSANYGIKTTELNVTGSTQIGSDLSVGNTFKANYVSSIFTNLGTGSTTTTINPNHMYVWGVVSSLNISFRVYDDLVRNEYMFQFTASSSGCNLTLPSGVKWASDNTIEAGKTYQVSVLNNMAVMAGV